MSWETVIGLEIHVQLSTKSKLFSGGSTEFGAESNTHVDLIDMGLPGVLPVANKEAFYKAIRFGLATGANINQTSSFDRKNYFYPDLPKGYQITQMAQPIVEKGSIKIAVDDYEKEINITRAHLEEDAGKSIHDMFEGETGVDLNRAGTPLLEIVSEPEISSAKEEETNGDERIETDFVDESNQNCLLSREKEEQTDFVFGDGETEEEGVLRDAKGENCRREEE